MAVKIKTRKYPDNNSIEKMVRKLKVPARAFGVFGNGAHSVVVIWAKIVFI